MECRPDCGACCVVPAIHQSFIGMPSGKPSGVSCVHLTTDFRCEIYGDPRRPVCCDGFEAERGICGVNRAEALTYLKILDEETTPRTAL